MNKGLNNRCCTNITGYLMQPKYHFRHQISVTVMPTPATHATASLPTPSTPNKVYIGCAFQMPMLSPAMIAEMSWRTHILPHTPDTLHHFKIACALIELPFETIPITKQVIFTFNPVVGIILSSCILCRFFLLIFISTSTSFA